MRRSRLIQPRPVGSATPAIAGAAYVAVWIVGLAIWPSSPGPDDPAREVVAGFAGHAGVGTAQFVLVEGLAAVPLAYVLVALARRAAGAGETRRSRRLLTTGLAACAISVSQAVLGVVLATSLASRPRVGAAGSVFNAVNRLDGAKMLLLATAIVTALLARRALGTPRLLAGLGVLAAGALVTSGIGYVTRTGGLEGFAALSLPLLLAWVAGSGAVTARSSPERDRPARPAPFPEPAS